MARRLECGRHPGEPLDGCRPCEALIDRVDTLVPDVDGELRWQEALDRFEAWLDRIGGSA